MEDGNRNEVASDLVMIAFERFLKDEHAKMYDNLLEIKKVYVSWINGG